MYNVQVEFIAIQISDEVRDEILQFLTTYNFPYIKSIKNKNALRNIFLEHFDGKHTLKWLKTQITNLNEKESANLTERDIDAIGLSETNRLHTRGLGNVLLSKGIKKCTTENSYGTRPISKTCWRNLEDKPQIIDDITRKGKPKILNIEEVIQHTFPQSYEELKRTDIPMIPQSDWCYHIMVPHEEERK